LKDPLSFGYIEITDKVKWISNDIEFHYYLRNDTQFKDAIEFEILIKKPIPTNEITLNIDMDNLIAYYQNPLYVEFKNANETHAFDNEGNLIAYRPIDIVDSIAFHYENYKNGTGKAFHLLRGIIEDSNGYKEYLKYSLKNNELKIVIPILFLKSAKYPLKIDPTFGKTSLGLSVGWWAGSNTLASRFYLSETGIIESIHLWNNDTTPTGTARVGIYNESGGLPHYLVLGPSGYLAASTGWVNFTGFNTQLEPGWYYISVFFTDYNYGRLWDFTGAGDPIHGDYDNRNLPNPWVETDSTTWAETTIYAYYSIPITPIAPVIMGESIFLPIAIILLLMGVYFSNELRR